MPFVKLDDSSLMQGPNQMSAIRSFVSQIVDYAGLFPPASLPMAEVVENYAAYLDCDRSWMLARLIIPAARLGEFAELSNGKLPYGADLNPWLISALVPPADAPERGMHNALGVIKDFNQKHSDPVQGLARVDAIELKASTPDQIKLIGQSVPADINAFLELPHSEDPEQLVSAINNGPSHLFAKIRSGGVTSDLIPPPDQVARFIDRCRKLGVGFKATAGLHHPIRNQYRLTYQDNADKGTMFGFVNMFAAACFAFACDSDESQLAAVLSETDMSNFKFENERLCWKDLVVTKDQIVEIRNNQAISFGSCSFDEPTRELEQFLSLAIEPDGAAQ